MKAKPVISKGLYLLFKIVFHTVSLLGVPGIVNRDCYCTGRRWRKEKKRWTRHHYRVLVRSISMPACFPQLKMVMVKNLWKKTPKKKWFLLVTNPRVFWSRSRFNPKSPWQPKLVRKKCTFLRPPKFFCDDSSITQKNNLRFYTVVKVDG